MRLMPRELARKRKARGMQLNYPGAVALISDEIVEAARDGKTMQEAMDIAMAVLTRADVMDGIAEMLDKLQIEAMFTDGTKLVTVYDPIHG
ncbi:MAG: urease subunit gamma [Nitrospinae bacterium]|nr:urease subunit gamma [Nitrospinota bacterium]